MNQMAGKQSVCFDEPVEIIGHAGVVGNKEGEGPLGKYMDLIVEDPLFGQKNWEESESQFLKTSCEIALRKAKKTKEEIRMAFCGDLLGQMIASSFGLKQLDIPFYGIYGACSSSGAALSAAAMAIGGGYADTVLAACSSHFASAEKEFRFPLGYGNQRPYSATWTVTGAGAFVLGKGSGRDTDTDREPAGMNRRKKGKVVIRGFTTGKIKDYGIQDSFNMGASMAPAAADTIWQSLEDFQKIPRDFDQIVTGDLGAVGQQLLFSLLKDNHIDITGNHLDCGLQIYEDDQQDTHAGGSGCAASAIVLSGIILPKLASGEWKRVLFVPTGALLSQVTFHQGRSIPSIAHAVWLEHAEEGGMQA